MYEAKASDAILVYIKKPMPEQMKLLNNRSKSESLTSTWWKEVNKLSL